MDIFIACVINAREQKAERYLNKYLSLCCDKYCSILKEIKDTVLAQEPGASVYLFGSYAHGDQHDESDIDILALLDKKNVTMADKERIWNSLYILSLDCDYIISTRVISRERWVNMYPVTPFRKNIEKDRILL